MRVSVWWWPAKILSIALSMSSARKSVRNPKRPRLTPTSGMFACISVLATLSMVPSPPITMAKSTLSPICSSLAVLKPIRSAPCAVFASSQTVIFFADKCRAKFAKSFCICCKADLFKYLPIMAIEANADLKAVIAELNHSLRLA